MIAYYQAPYAQRGYGFGGIFRGLAKLISPVARGFTKLASDPTVQSIAKDALSTGVNMAANAIEGRDTAAAQESERLLKRARTKVANRIRKVGHTNKGSPYVYSDTEVEDDTSEDEYDTSITPKYKKKPKLRGHLVKKKKRTIFDE